MSKNCYWAPRGSQEDFNIKKLIEIVQGMLCLLTTQQLKNVSFFENV